MSSAVSMARGKLLGDQHVGIDLARAGQPVGQGVGLLAPERREATAGPVAADGAGHGGVGLAVADEDEAGHVSFSTKPSSWRRLRHSYTPSVCTPYSPTMESPVFQ